MRPFHGLPCNLLAFLITTQVLPVFAQEAPKPPSEPASAPAAAVAPAALRPPPLKPLHQKPHPHLHQQHPLLHRSRARRWKR
jgi:hypothetical protein